MQDLETTLRASEDEKIYCEMCMEEVSELFIVGPEQISVCGVCKGMEESWQKEQVQKVEADDGWHDLRKSLEDLPDIWESVWLCYRSKEQTFSEEAFWGKGHWCDASGEEIEDGFTILGWHALPTIPDRFKSKEKV